MLVTVAVAGDTAFYDGAHTWTPAIRTLQMIPTKPIDTSIGGQLPSVVKSPLPTTSPSAAPTPSTNPNEQCLAQTPLAQQLGGMLALRLNRDGTLTSVQQPDPSHKEKPFTTEAGTLAQKFNIGEFVVSVLVTDKSAPKYLEQLFASQEGGVTIDAALVNTGSVASPQQVIDILAKGKVAKFFVPTNKETGITTSDGAEPSSSYINAGLKKGIIPVVKTHGTMGMEAAATPHPTQIPLTSSTSTPTNTLSTGKVTSSPTQSSSKVAETSQLGGVDFFVGSDLINGSSAQTQADIYKKLDSEVPGSVKMTGITLAFDAKTNKVAAQSVEQANLALKAGANLLVLSGLSNDGKTATAQLSSFVQQFAEKESTNKPVQKRIADGYATMLATRGLTACDIMLAKPATASSNSPVPTK